MTLPELQAALSSSTTWKKEGRFLISPSGRVINHSNTPVLIVNLALSRHANAVLAGIIR